MDNSRRGWFRCICGYGAALAATFDQLHDVWSSGGYSIWIESFGLIQLRKTLDNVGITTDWSITLDVGITIISHPPAITIDSLYIHHSQMGGLWHCYTHISSNLTMKLLSLVRSFVWQSLWHMCQVCLKHLPKGTSSKLRPSMLPTNHRLP